MRVARRRIAVRLTLGFLLIIVIVSAIFSVVGVQFISSRVVAEAESRVEADLSAAREMYQAGLTELYNVVRINAGRLYLRQALLSGNIEAAAEELTRTWAQERLDMLTVADSDGVVLLRTTNPYVVGDTQADELVSAVLESGAPVAATAIVPAEVLQVECPHVAEMARCPLVETSGARPTEETEETAGMMWKAAAPILDRENRVIGVLYGGILLNRRNDVVDRIRETVFRGARYAGKDLGDVSIFQNDARIATTYRENGNRGIGTRVVEDVFDRVITQGQRRTGRVFVVDTWYIAAYEPIRDIKGEVIGILGIGVLDQPYVDLKRRTRALFLAITLGGALMAIGLSHLIARRLLVPIRQLVSASWQVAHGNLDASVEVGSEDELAELADSFNIMASALKARDKKLAEFTKRKIMESERLAVVGQLAADVAHELNNPLQGIVAYSHLLLERTPSDDPRRDSIQKIVNQANRSATIIRALLDFSRPRKPSKKPSNLNLILEECLSLVENQALFHNIQVERRLSQLPQIVVDPSQVQQVFMNMILNAAEAMNGGGRLTLATRCDPTGRFVEVEFTDTGHGISPENLERIFDPFFTTKEVGHGTGLGLAISYGIIREHKGSISVESEVGKGTTFVVQLPATAEEEESTGADQAQNRGD